MDGTSPNQDGGEPLPEKPGKKRGPCLLKDHKLEKQQKSGDGGKLRVQYKGDTLVKDEVGEYFRDYLGVLARTKVPITCTDWRLLVEKVKEDLWKEVLEKFEGCDDYKEAEMEHASRALRAFRSRLNRDFLKKNIDPKTVYEFITKDEWEKYVATRSSSEYKGRCEKNFNSAKKNKNNTAMGRKGYVPTAEGVMNEKAKELLKSGDIREGQESNVTVDRVELWISGRVKKDGTFVNDDAAVVAEYLVSNFDLN